MKRLTRPLFALAAVAVLSGCSAHQANTVTRNTMQAAPAGPFLLTAGDNLGYALYNTQKGMVARGYNNTPVQLPALASVPGLE